MDIGQWIIIGIVAFGASWLTLISGFGLGTLLTPVFLLFFPLPEAIMLTAIVHVLNNIFKFGLLYKNVNTRIVLLFGLSGILGAYFGSSLIDSLDTSIAYTCTLPEVPTEVSYFSLAVGVLMILFALQELIWGRFSFKLKSIILIPGGLISGFFGGLSGHQGALRSMFLLKAGLSATAYVATGTTIALLIDFTRIPVYLASNDISTATEEWIPLLIATLSAFIGAFIGKRMIAKVTIRVVQWIAGLLMMAIAILMLLGFL